MCFYFNDEILAGGELQLSISCRIYWNVGHFLRIWAIVPKGNIIHMTVTKYYEFHNCKHIYRDKEKISFIVYVPAKMILHCRETHSIHFHFHFVSFSTYTTIKMSKQTQCVFPFLFRGWSSTKLFNVPKIKDQSLNLTFFNAASFVFYDFLLPESLAFKNK